MLVEQGDQIGYLLLFTVTPFYFSENVQFIYSLYIICMYL